MQQKNVYLQIFAIIFLYETVIQKHLDNFDKQPKIQNADCAQTR